MNVATALAKGRNYNMAVKLLETVSKAADEGSKPLLAAKTTEIRNSAADYWVGSATYLAINHPTWTEIINGHVNKAAKFAPERADEISKAFVFLEGSHHSVIVTREAYEAIRKKA